MSKLGRGLLKALKEVSNTYSVNKNKPFLKRVTSTLYTIDLLDPFFDAYYFVRRICRKVKQVINFLPLVWRFENWDSSFVMEFNAYLFEQLYKGCYEEGNHLYRSSEARKLKTVVALCKRMARDHDYTDVHYDDFLKKYGKDKDSFMYSLETKEIDGKRYTTYSDPVKKRLTEKEYERYKKELTELTKLEKYLFEQDIDLFHKILKKNYKKWWD